MNPASTAPLIGAINHVAIVTRDLDRFIDFYTGVLGLELKFREDTPAFCHAILRSGELSWLHPVEVADNPHGTASQSMFQRGHLDHIGLTVATPESFSELRRRLVACGASDGSIENLGAFDALWFSDPDGMRVELALIKDPALGHFHAPVPRHRERAPALAIERLTDTRSWPVVDALLREYVPWVMQQLGASYGVHFDNVDAESELHHAAFADEAQQLMRHRSRGRLLLARIDDEPAAVVALKPVNEDTAEIKRMYVRPSARGHGVARALLERALADARAEGFRAVRLETMNFMVEAWTMYKSFGFVDVRAFSQSQAEISGLSSVTRYMELTLQEAPVPEAA